MGNWVIIIEGTGQHHNRGNPNDADVIADEAVQMLRRAGQQVENATFTSGGRLVLPNVGTIRPAKQSEAAPADETMAAPDTSPLAGCGNWKPKHGVGPYCANCGFHEEEHRDTYPYARTTKARGI